jgi:predicted lipid-binding transport protein (Tim44 family)
MMGLLAVAVMVAIGFFMRKRAATQHASAAGPAGMQYARVESGAMGNSDKASSSGAPNAPAYKVLMPANTGSAIGSAIGSGIGAANGGANRIPADFDTAAFERNAKVNFIRLQAANDAGNLDDIRQFTTPEMFAELKMELSERGAVAQKTDVLNVQAQVIDVEEDADRYLVSVRFDGVIRDEIAQEDESFNEVWHMVKPRHGGSGWVLSGIQQMV